MATTRTTKKPAKPAPKPAQGYQRDHERERSGRATSKQLNLSLTEEERATLDALARALEAPLKASILSAARAALVALEGGTYPAVRRELRADLEPAKPGPKPADDSDE